MHKSVFATTKTWVLFLRWCGTLTPLSPVLFICRELRGIFHSSLGTQPSQAPYIGWLAPVAHQVRLASCPSDEYAQIPLRNLKKVKSGKSRKPIHYGGKYKNIRGFQSKKWQIFQSWGILWKICLAITDLPLIGHQCSHKDNNSAHHRPHSVVA